MRRVLVTGATGFIGRWSLSRLLERGYEVHALSSRGVPGAAGVQWHHVDAMNTADVLRVMTAARPTHLLHFAWYAEHGRFWSSPLNLRWVQASLDLMQAFQQCGGQRLVMAGTCAEYGRSDDPCRESETPLAPDTLYGTCKHALQLIASRYAAQTNLSFAWGRIFFLYGPGEPPNRLVPSVIRALLHGEPARCSHGNQVRDFLTVEDVADAFVALLDSAVQGAVNIGSGTPTRLRDLVEAIGRQLDRRELIRLGAIASPPGEPRVLIPDTTRLTSEVKWRPHDTLHEGLDRTITWWREHDRLGAARHS